MECIICVEKFNNTSRKEVNCIKCKAGICRSCHMTYMMDNKSFAHCMNCKYDFDRKFLVNNFTKKFINKEYKLHKEDLLYNIEISKLPEVQKFIELDNFKIELSNIIQLIEFKKKFINKNYLYYKWNINYKYEAKHVYRYYMYDEILLKIYNIKNNNYSNFYDFYDKNIEGYEAKIITDNYYFKLHRNIQSNLYKDHKKVYNKQLFRLKNISDSLSITEIDNIDFDTIKINIDTILNLNIDTIEDILETKPIKVQKNINKNNFTMSCANNGCKGFLSTNWKCGICNMYTCKKCHMLEINNFQFEDEKLSKQEFEIFNMRKEDKHTCKKEDIESFDLIKKDSKPCPKCKSMIFKIEGCYMMFCTICTTSFDWKNGKILTKNLHNPHYFEYLNKNKIVTTNNENLDICGIQLGHIQSNDLRDIFRIILHLEDITLKSYDNNNNNNLELNKQYLLNKIDKDNYKTKIQKRNKKRDQNDEIYINLKLYIDTVKAILLEYAFSANKDEKIYIKKIENLILFVNEKFIDISNVYSCVKYKIRMHSSYI